MAEFKRSKLLTHNDLELDCVIISRKPLIAGGEEVLCYAQNRIVKGFVQGEDDFVAEIAIVVGFAIIPELAELLYEIPSPY
jgi:hypothetical protein